MSLSAPVGLVGEPSPGRRRCCRSEEVPIDPVFALLVASRWIHFASVSLVFGGAFFWFAIGGRQAAAGLRNLPVTATRTIRLLRVAALVAAVSGVAWLAATIANVTGGFATLVDPGMFGVFFFETPFGGPSLARLILLAALAVGSILPLASIVTVSIDTLAGATLLVSQAWLGHAAEGGTSAYGLAMISSYAVHVVGAAAWVGGLPPLALAIAERRRRGDGSDDLLARYSAMAIVAASLIILSGIANTLFHTSGEIAELAHTTYGAILFTKLALVAAMLALASINRFVLMPRLRERGASGSRSIEKSIAAETLLAVLVLGAAALLGISPPPH